MFTEIILFLLDTVFTLFGMALLLRLWMQLTRLPSRNPVSQGVFQVTDWLVRPLRRIIPGIGGIDWATVLAAYLTAVAFLVCRALVLEADPIAFLPVILGIALLTMLKWGISMVMWVTLLMAVLSWTQEALNTKKATADPPRKAVRGATGSFTGIFRSRRRACRPSQRYSAPRSHQWRCWCLRTG